MPIPFLMLIPDVVLLAFAVYFGVQGRTPLSLSTFAATLFLGIWQARLLADAKSSGKPLRVTLHLRSQHYVQASLQICIYLYWSLYWDGVRQFVPMILVQLAFAYAIEALLSWTKFREWRVGFGPFPIILSINLFLWFREEYFFLQFALLLLTYLGREYLHWTRDGRSTHIFNPSGFSLAFVTVLLLVTDNLWLCRGLEIVESQTLPPSMFEVIFLLGLVTQFLYVTTPVSLGAVAAGVLAFHAFIAIWGTPASPRPFEVAVFLGMTFLVTDPSTSPRSTVGKLLFGAAYGLGVFLTLIGLRWVQQPSFVDKIWMVPIVNLLVPEFDRIGKPVDAWLLRWIGPLSKLPGRLGWWIVYVALFVAVLPSLKYPVISSQTLFPPPPPSTTLPHFLNVQLQNREHCREVIPEPFKPFGFAAEAAEYRKMRDIYLYHHDVKVRLGFIER